MLPELSRAHETRNKQRIQTRSHGRSSRQMLFFLFSNYYFYFTKANVENGSTSSLSLGLLRIHETQVTLASMLPQSRKFDTNYTLGPSQGSRFSSTFPRVLHHESASRLTISALFKTTTITKQQQQQRTYPILPSRFSRSFSNRDDSTAVTFKLVFFDNLLIMSSSCCDSRVFCQTCGTGKRQEYFETYHQLPSSIRLLCILFVSRAAKKRVNWISTFRSTYPIIVVREITMWFTAQCRNFENFG